MENFNQPAFPPQVAQDNLGRLIAPIPGMTKLEYAAIQLLPFYLKLGLDEQIRHKGRPVYPYEAAVLGAIELFKELNLINNEKSNNTVIEQP
jgi:hypothetical protein